jgi:hypothetical protein
MKSPDPTGKTLARLLKTPGYPFLSLGIKIHAILFPPASSPEKEFLQRQARPQSQKGLHSHVGFLFTFHPSLIPNFS